MKKKLAKEIYEDGYVEGYKDAIVEILEDLYKYKEQIGFQVHHTLNIMIKKWEEK